ncbi:hypothetical protein EKK58_04060 [Candidatus Dependentiae bacterium]|nr:MAG: hypothetical protein EKK58_04060 [Candidatus Dependentiae bacterium]
MRIFNLLFLFFCWQDIVSKEHAVSTGKFKRLYDSLKQKEHTLVKNIKKKYPNIHKNSWKSYDALGNKAFNAIKKGDDLMPACDALDRFPVDTWNSGTVKDFLTAYAKCSLEKSGIDPEKVPVIHCLPNDSLSSNKNKCQTTTGIYFKNTACLIDFYNDNGYKKKGIAYQPELHIAAIDYKDQDDLTFQLVMINKAVSLLATSAALKEIVFKNLVLSYYGVEPLFAKSLLKELGENSLYYGDIEQKLYAMFDENALLISLMQHPELVDYVCNNLENQAKQTSQIKRLLKFLYKIKKLKVL